MMFENDFKLLMLITELCYTDTKPGDTRKMQPLPVAARPVKNHPRKKK